MKFTLNPALLSWLHIYLKYTITDNSPLSGKGFYRLQQIDMDGITYSQVVLFSSDKPVNRISVFPNPARAFTVASITASKDETVQLQLIDPSGKQVLNRSKKLLKELMLSCLTTCISWFPVIIH